MATSNLTSTLTLTSIDFLLDDKLLIDHLSKENPVPSAFELLNQILKDCVDQVDLDESIDREEKAESPAQKENRLKKLESLKIISLQAAAFLKWELDVLEKLPLTKQLTLMNAVSDYTDQNDFLSAVWDRWVLRSSQTELKGNYERSKPFEEFLKFINPSICQQRLENTIVLKKQNGPILVPIPLSFSTNSPPDFDRGLEINFTAFHSMIHIDLGIYLLYEGSPKLAVEHFKKQKLPMTDFPFYKIADRKLKGYMMAVGILKPGEKETKIKLDKGQVTANGKADHEVLAGNLKDMMMVSLKRKLNVDVDPIKVNQGQALDRDKMDGERDPTEQIMSVYKRHLLETCVPMEVKNLLIRLHSLNSTQKSFSTVFPISDIPAGVQKAISIIPAGLLQDFFFILTSRARTLLKMKLYNESRSWIRTANSELLREVEIANNTNVGKKLTPYIQDMGKLSRLLKYETLLINMEQLLAEWPNGKKHDILAYCKDCLRNFRLETVEIHPQIIETSLMSLINIEEHALVARFDISQQRWQFLEFLSLLNAACMDIHGHKDSASSYRALWNAVLPILTISGTAKRVSLNQATGLLPSRSTLTWVIERCRSNTLMSLFVSLLSRLHNHIVTDTSLHIQTGFLHIWPNVLDDVTTSSEYKSRAVGGSNLNIIQIRDLLIKLLRRPGNNEMMWLRCTGDVYLSSGNPSLAMKCYLEYLSLCTESFQNHQAQTWADELLFLKMIKCCMVMRTSTEAMILCQFLRVTDYARAHSLAEDRMTTDSQDALYVFIWDVGLLEYVINMHATRNATGKMEQAIRQMRQIELTVHNNDEMKRAAIQLKKSQFMRTLANRYIFL